MLTKILLLSVLCLLSACSSLSKMDYLADAALVAVKDPLTWAPVVGAAVLASEDKHLAEKTATKTPLYGSTTRADDISGHLNISLNVAAIVSSFFVPDAVQSNVVSDALALSAAAGTTYALKSAVDRDRPDHSGQDSFPSGHASQAFAAARVLRDNFHEYDVQQTTEQWLNAGVYTAAALTGWGRLEAGKHHPSDVLAGAALGNMMVVFINEAFAGHQRLHANVNVDPVAGVAVLNLYWPF